MFFLLFSISLNAYSQSISCGQSNCVPTSSFPSTVDIQEKATFSAIDLNFLGVDLTVSGIPSQKSKDVRLFLLNGVKDDAKDLTLDLSSSSVGDNASNLVVISDNINNLNLKLNGYNGKNGKDASEICAENIQSLKYGAASNLKYLQNRANPANGLTAGRCGALDVSDLATDKFACADPNFTEVTSTQSINVERVQKVSKCMAIIPQPICVQPAYRITCDYDLWIKNMPLRQGGGEGQLNIRPDGEFSSSNQSTFDVMPYYTPDGGGARNFQFNNVHKNNILTFKQEITDGTDGMFFWDIANYLISTTYYELHDGCSSGGFGATNAVSAPYIPAYSNQPYTPFTRANPVIPNNIYFSNAGNSFNPVNIQQKSYELNPLQLQQILNQDDGIFQFCNGNASRFSSDLAPKLAEVSAHISSLESNLSPSSVAYFRRNNLNAYDDDGCNGRIFATARYRNDFTFRARTFSNPVITSPGMDATGLRLEGGTLVTPNTNAERSYQSPSGWKMDIMKGFAGSDPLSSNTLLQKTCNTGYNLVSVESSNSIKYENILPDTSLACNAVQSCTNPSDPSCLLDPASLAKYTYIGLDPDPTGTVETVTCTLGGNCPVENRLTEDSRFLDTLVPTNGENASEQGSGFVFVYDVNNRAFQTQVGQAGAGGRNDLASPSQVRICAKKRDATTDPNSNYKNDPSVEFKRINWKTFDVNGGGAPGLVPQFTPKKIFLYKKVDPGVLYLLKKELL